MAPENAAELSNMVSTSNQNATAMPFIHADFLTISAIFPGDEVQKSLETVAKRHAKQRRLLNKMWTEVKVR